MTQQLLAHPAGHASLHTPFADDAGQERHCLDDAQANQQQRQDREPGRVASREHAIEDLPEDQR